METTEGKYLLWGLGIFVIVGLITVFWSISLAKKGEVIVFPSKKCLLLFVVPFVVPFVLLAVFFILGAMNVEISETHAQWLVVIGICIGAGCIIGELIWTIVANVRNHSNPFYVIIALLAKLYILLAILFCHYMLSHASFLEEKRTKKVKGKDGKYYEVRLTGREIRDNQERAREIRLRYSPILAGIYAATIYVSHVQKHRQHEELENMVGKHNELKNMEEMTMKNIYPRSEQELCSRLDALQTEWKDVCNYDESKFVYDGFYPHYTKQKVKILFIGRENRGLDGECGSYVSQLYSAYKENSIGGKSINAYQTHSLQFYITYGLNNNATDWSEIPSAAELTEDFATERGISWAYMNLSKLSNTGEHSQVADWCLINNFCEATKEANEKSGRNFWAEEINLLDPDLIIGMNLGVYYDCLGESEWGDLFGSSAVRVRKIKIGTKTYPLLDTYHFSAKKSPKDDFYDPIVEAYGSLQEMR